MVDKNWKVLRFLLILILIIGILIPVIGNIIINLSENNDTTEQITNETVSIHTRSYLNDYPNISIYTAYSGHDTISERNFHYVTDDKSGVVYILYESEYGVTMTPMYNSDGTLLTKKQLELP